ncbi:hypothetical protein LFL96_08525 [Paraburkholderia sp. D15]|uniref:hypothetical protein n=1 Tax=Paraburkholderia sp. D15 TaxID=2880218 RepID=UPI002479887F|nr:hypothetical protein [Paraburkholderia sp. D15]WGS51529.1 hypothetical protein LFL96_08525 [Paraburkholderia sp. D15]
MSVQASGHRYGTVATSRDTSGSTGNLRLLRALAKESMRGAPPGAADFEAQQQDAGAKIATLSAKEQDYYHGAQAALIAKYECATTTAERDDVEHVYRAFAKTLDAACRAEQHDPARRTQSRFNLPYGAQCLGDEGKRLGARLERYRAKFNHTANPHVRAAELRAAAHVRQEMETEIGQRARQKLDDVQRSEDEARAAVDAAFNAAKTIESGDPYDREIAFTRLEFFAQRAFASPETAQAFKAMQQQDPEKFAVLKQWEADVQDKTKWAQGSIASDPFRRSFPVPDVPAGYLGVDENTLPAAHYGETLLDRYRARCADVKNAHTLYHAAIERGPIKQAYIASVMPPKPEWQQELEEALGRVLLSPIPFGGVLANLFGPKSNMSPSLRAGLNIVCGLLGGNGPGLLQRFPLFGQKIADKLQNVSRT